MIKFAAVASLVLVPLLWGAMMVPVMDYIEKRFFKNARTGEESDE